MEGGNEAGGIIVQEVIGGFSVPSEEWGCWSQLQGCQSRP